MYQYVRYLFMGICFSSACSAQGKTINVGFYLLTDSTKKITIDQVISNSEFLKVNDIATFNFGISRIDHWIKIKITSDTFPQKYSLYIQSIVPDTIEVYEQSTTGYKKTLAGEAFHNEGRYINYPFTAATKELTLFLKITGDGQPLYLPIAIQKGNLDFSKEYKTIVLSGFIYGSLFLIMVLSIVLFINTKENLYLYFFFLNLCSSSVILYFDGYVKLFFIQDSIYWNNEFIAIAFCGSFIATNYYISTFLNLKIHSPTLVRFYHLFTFLFIGILLLSFWHPTGFQIYIVINILITSLEALLFLASVLYVRKAEEKYFLLQLLSIVLIIFFGTITQLFFLGYLPINFLTRYAVHGIILPQLVLQSFALWKRMEMLARDRAAYLALSEKYSQSLISDIENERTRLAGEFHDSIGQNLLVIRNRLLLMLKGNFSNDQVNKLNDLASITSTTLTEIREIAQNLRPSTLDTIGLTSALIHMMEKLKPGTTIQIKYSFDSIDGVLEKEFEINAFRIVQELMNNVIKHSNAKAVTVNIEKKTDSIKIVVEDNGVGFDPEVTFISSNGLSGIKHRVNLLKGDCFFVSEKNLGTCVTIKIPVEK